MTTISQDRLESVASYISALEMGTPFVLSPTGHVNFSLDIAPEVFHDDKRDVVIASVHWTALTGMTGQYGYNGAVMHRSEFVGIGIVKRLLEIAEDGPETFAIVVVECLDDDEPAGWAVIHYTPLES